jgi:hypothetical protein
LRGQRFHQTNVERELKGEEEGKVRKTKCGRSAEIAWTVVPQVAE